MVSKISTTLRRSLIADIIPGQLVDAVIMPVAPHAAVIPGKFYHTGRQKYYKRLHPKLTLSSLHGGHQFDGL